MNKVTKICLIILICLLNLFILSISQIYPISISLNMATFFQIPIYFWLLIIISPILLFIIAKQSKNKLIPILCAMFYFFILYSYGLYFISHPTISDIGSSTLFQELLTSINHIGPSEINIESYFQWPVFFIFSKLFSSLLGISPILTSNLGFFSLILIFPAIIILFFKRKNGILNPVNYFIIPVLFLILSYFFLNDQFVPQFLALIYLIILFGCYVIFRETKNRLFFILIIIFYTLTVFTHAFFYLFFLVAIIFEKVWSEYIERVSSVISIEMIILFVSIPYTFITTYLLSLRRAATGQSWLLIDYITSERNPIGSGYQLNPLYYLVPEIYDKSISLIAKGIIAVVFIIVIFGFLLSYLKKKGIIDLSIIAGAFSWFLLGFSNMVLGQRALQIVPLALSNYFKYPHRSFSYLSKIVIVILLIAPSLIVANTLINLSISGERLIQDNQENIACKFLDSHLENERYYIFGAQNAYPTGINFELGRLPPTLSRANITGLRQYLDFIIDSPKLRLRHNFINIPLPISNQDFFVYNSRDVYLISI